MVLYQQQPAAVAHCLLRSLKVHLNRSFSTYFTTYIHARVCCFWYVCVSLVELVEKRARPAAAAAEVKETSLEKNSMPGLLLVLSVCRSIFFVSPTTQHTQQTHTHTHAPSSQFSYCLSGGVVSFLHYGLLLLILVFFPVFSFLSPRLSSSVATPQQGLQDCPPLTCLDLDAFASHLVKNTKTLSDSFVAWREKIPWKLCRSPFWGRQRFDGGYQKRTAATGAVAADVCMQCGTSWNDLRDIEEKEGEAPPRHSAAVTAWAARLWATAAAAVEEWSASHRIRPSTPLLTRVMRRRSCVLIPVRSCCGWERMRFVMLVWLKKCLVDWLIGYLIGCWIVCIDWLID